MKSSETKAIEIFRAQGGILRTCEALKFGVHPRTLYELRDSGQIERASRGLFLLKGISPLRDPDLVVVARRIPSAVLCLTSALAFHRLTTQVPHVVQIALERGSRIPRLQHPPIEVFQFSPETFHAGVEISQVDGISVRIYSKEKTLADVFKFRNKIGMDVVIEAVRSYSKMKRRRFDLVLSYAKLCRNERLIRPYLESIL